MSAARAAPAAILLLSWWGVAPSVRGGSAIDRALGFSERDAET